MTNMYHMLTTWAISRQQKSMVHLSRDHLSRFWAWVLRYEVIHNADGHYHLPA